MSCTLYTVYAFVIKSNYVIALFLFSIPWG